MNKDKSLTNVLLDIASTPTFVDPMFNYANDLAWQHQRREEEEKGND